jgi:hypothetical protein
MTLAGLRKDIDAAPATSENSSLRYSMREFVIGKARSSRDSLGKLGMSALLAYDFVSNISGVIVIAVSLAWFVFCKKTGVSPLDPGQKPAFLVTYTAFSVTLNVVRPARFALSMAISPYFERVRKAISTYLGVSTHRAVVIMIVNVIIDGCSCRGRIGKLVIGRAGLGNCHLPSLVKYVTACTYGWYRTTIKWTQMVGQHDFTHATDDPWCLP